MNILPVLGDSPWEQFRYVRMSLFSQTGAPLLDHQAFNNAALVKRLGRTEVFANSHKINDYVSFIFPLHR